MPKAEEQSRRGWHGSPNSHGWDRWVMKQHQKIVVDNLTPHLRSKVMRSVKSRDTKPEMFVRKLLHSLGYRYRIHAAAIPGRSRPDIVFRKRKKIILVHGCFWHVHQDCKGSHLPDSPFWRRKLENNRSRDARTMSALQKAGWTSLVVWECELENPELLECRLQNFLGD
jgi:DNA mismatch endonuclease (patch repair protein)